jgi:4-carboxymuconolactone decarboxylase
MGEGQGLGRGVAALVGLSAALATRDRDRVLCGLRRARVDAAPAEIDEIILQAHLFVGFPDTLRAMVLWREMSPAPPDGPARDDGTWGDRGERVCRTVYADNYDRLRQRVASLHPDLDRWMVVGGYGRVLGRPGVDLVTRELCIVALLAVWNAPDQLNSHLRGALHAGASPAQVEEALGVAASILEAGRARENRALWERVRGRLERS